MLTGTFPEILAADVAVIVVVLVGGVVVLLGRAAVVLLAGEAAVLLVVTVNVNHTFKIHDVILQEIDIVLKSYMYQSYNNMIALVWLIIYFVFKLFLTKTNINFHIFNFALPWQPSLLRTIRGTLYAS